MWSGAQLGYVLVFLCLVIVVFEAVPGGGPRRSSLIGRWASSEAAIQAAQPAVELDLAADGSFVLRMTVASRAARRVRVQGRYEIVQGQLVMVLRGHRMIWTIASERAGTTLLHRTKRGQAYRLRRA